MTKNLTEGSPARLILMFTLPLIAGNIFQQLYAFVDTLIVGRFLGVEALAAVGCTGSLMFLMLGFVIGFSTGLPFTRASGTAPKITPECGRVRQPVPCSPFWRPWC